MENNCGHEKESDNRKEGEETEKGKIWGRKYELKMF